MFNLTVSEAHTYYVGTKGWLVHNCDHNELVRRLTENNTIALGAAEALEAFATKIGGKTSNYWSPAQYNWRFEENFRAVVGNPSNPVHFNLDLRGGRSINIVDALAKGAKGDSTGDIMTHGFTNWEIYEISRNPQWWSRVTFYSGGKTYTPGEIFGGRK